MRRTAWVLPTLAALYAAVVIPISLHKGSDFDIHLEHVELLLAHRPVYATPPPFGAWWPPLPLVGLVPFAWLAHASVPLAKGSFALANVACLAFAVARARYRFGGAAWLALAAVAVPLQTNFEYLNLNAVLLALLMLAADDLSAGREVRAGLWIGLMTALKVFPGLLFGYLAYRRQWRGLVVGVAVALSATLVAAALPWGPGEGLATLRRWSVLSAAAVPQMHGRSQSLPALPAARPRRCAFPKLVASLAATAPNFWPRWFQSCLAMRFWSCPTASRSSTYAPTTRSCCSARPVAWSLRWSR